jgi:hypothetical protein
MVANKHSIKMEQAKNMGMLPPAKGLAAMEVLLHSIYKGSAVGVQGVASKYYWQLLFQGQMEVPDIFAIVLQEKEVCVPLVIESMSRQTSKTSIFVISVVIMLT